MQSTSAQFTADELENSFPLAPDRRFREPASVSLLTTIMLGIRGSEHRQRRRSDAADRTFTATVEALIANLAAAHMNVIDRNQYVAVSFNKNDYSGSELSHEAMATCRDYLADLGLIDVAPGFQRPDADGIRRLGRRTRLRATDKMRALIDMSGIDRKSFTRPAKAIVQIRQPRRKGLPEPDDIADSRLLLAAINERLMSTDIRLDRVMEPIQHSQLIENEGEERDALHRKRTYAGDHTAMTLYRVFKYDWRSGGRIYGGWWMSLPRAIRPYLRINGSPTVELDYTALHPTLLYLRANTPMPADPYVDASASSDAMRQLGKRTFNRLLNRQEDNPIERLELRASPGDRDVLGKVPFKQYLDTLVHRLFGIQRWFGTGEGIRLQYEDSVLALHVLKTMEKLDIPTLPIHDSFIVPMDHEAQLRKAMQEAFRHYGIVPKIDKKTPRVRQG
ncbi:hypothetical protein [Sphingobium yanoikuyae]|uniref:hypothetical protein n=1 Tax=Sphingobium yanoikuyae TaxID=13690 RepID=UPI0028A2B1AF|nr:hypothetical protein [Sphingobium yanoikuyae]